MLKQIIGKKMFNFSSVIKHSYEKSGTHTTEVRRMFLERKDMAAFKAYTTKQNDP